MGVSGLWELVQDAGQPRSFEHLAVKGGFEDNTSSRRAYRIGIDMSIWLRHAYYSKKGENPELRLLFFRLCRLAELPLIPLFVFDGRKRPKVKRGSKMGKSGSHELSRDLKEMIEAFGMEHREALGEAEAELAYLNSKGYIDAILTDDCDAFVFGGRTIIKNWSATLSGNRSDVAAQQNSGSNKKHPQVTVYSADRIRDLTRGGLILYALLNGGDYHQGIPGFGPAHSFGLAKCGFGDSLLREYRAKGQHILPFLVQWREEMNTELATNSRGFLPGSRHRIPDSFPDLAILELYANPVITGGGPPLDRREMNLKKIAGLCEKHFEWGYSDSIIERFRRVLWQGAVMHVLRRAALEADAKEREKRSRSGNEDRMIRGALKPSRAEAVGTSAALVKQYLAPPDTSKMPKEDRLARYASAFVNRSQAPQAALRREEIPDPYPLISKIVGTRCHGSTDNLLEYRVEVCPVQLVELTKEGIEGSRRPPEQPKQTKKPPPAPESILRVWIPGSIMHQVHPGLVEDFAMREEAKSNRGSRGKRKAPEPEDDDDDEERIPSSSQPARTIQPAPVAHRAAPVATPSANTRTQPAPEPARMISVPLPREESNTVVDPWFAVGDGTRNERFLFTFPNPDEPDFGAGDEAFRFMRDVDMDIDLSWEGSLTERREAARPARRNGMDLSWESSLGERREAARQAEEHMVIGNVEFDDDEDDLPLNPLDAMWDQLIDGRSKAKPKGKKPRQSKNNAASTTSSTRIRRNDDLLTRLDKLDARRAGAAKKRKVGEDEIEVGPVVSAFPAMADF